MGPFLFQRRPMMGHAPRPIEVHAHTHAPGPPVLLHLQLSLDRWLLPDHLLALLRALVPPTLLPAFLRSRAAAPPPRWWLPPDDGRALADVRRWVRRPWLHLDALPSTPLGAGPPLSLALRLRPAQLAGLQGRPDLLAALGDLHVPLPPSAVAPPPRLPPLSLGPHTRLTLYGEGGRWGALPHDWTPPPAIRALGCHRLLLRPEQLRVADGPLDAWCVVDCRRCAGGGRADWLAPTLGRTRRTWVWWCPDAPVGPPLSTLCALLRDSDRVPRHVAYWPPRGGAAPVPLDTIADGLLRHPRLRLTLRLDAAAAAPTARSPAPLRQLGCRLTIVADLAVASAVARRFGPGVRWIPFTNVQTAAPDPTARGWRRAAIRGAAPARGPALLTTVVDRPAEPRERHTLRLRTTVGGLRAALRDLLLQTVAVPEALEMLGRPSPALSGAPVHGPRAWILVGATDRAAAFAALPRVGGTWVCWCPRAPPDDGGVVALCGRLRALPRVPAVVVYCPAGGAGAVDEGVLEEAVGECLTAHPALRLVLGLPGGVRPAPGRRTARPELGGRLALVATAAVLDPAAMAGLCSHFGPRLHWTLLTPGPPSARRVVGAWYLQLCVVVARTTDDAGPSLDALLGGLPRPCERLDLYHLHGARPSATAAPPGLRIYGPKGAEEAPTGWWVDVWREGTGDGGG